MDDGRLCKHIEVGNIDDLPPHLLVPLLGRFKGVTLIISTLIGDISWMKLGVCTPLPDVLGHVA